LGRYANDAAGMGRVKGLRNNAHYKIAKGRAFILASRNIKAGSEILVAYGKAYWDAMLEA
jgi:SET domain-containing protein